MIVILDAGPLVAYFDRKDHWHAWARDQANKLPAPFLSTESVLSEACHLLERAGVSHAPLFEMIENGSIRFEFDLQTEWQRISEHMRRFADQPMSLADATLVRLAELHENGVVFTVDKHFRVYRKHGRRQIPLIFPEE